MKSYELKAEIIRATDNFIEYLIGSGLDKIQHKLRGTPIINGSRIILPLQKALHNPELAEISVRKHRCSPDELEILGYDEKDKCLIVRECDYSGRFSGAHSSDIAIQTDIKFLANNIRKWAFFHGEEISIPHISACDAESISFIPSSNEQQLIAVNGIIHNALSYVWGVPGAGKTTKVLARGVEYCFAQNKKVLLTAPTNSALERALCSIMQVLDEIGIDTENILRLGVPSREFRKQYPSLCLDNSRDEEVRAKCRRRIASARMIAVTVDSYTAMLSDNGLFKADHIFLDEAGYCPLIKMLPLLNARSSLTLLGDHRQLPPICPVNHTALRNDPSLSLWAQSAVYCESLLNSESIDIFAQGYFTSAPPLFCEMKRFDLFCSYRFGGGLARVLAQHVYGAELHGLASSSPKITIIDAHNAHVPSTRVSRAEAYAIMRFLQENNCSDYVVLTPYNKQAALLQQLINADEEHVMTIHRAQGREWNTVILSVVDTQNMFFTNSSRQDTHGLEVLNTALSRAKHELVIACNVSFWRTQRGQLISSVISEGLPAA